ncbi:MAG: trigger factor [Candidatus Eisenbacteria bacterium]|nr:trigger factor [Candidatus Eisenbacteria bacterium]
MKVEVTEAPLWKRTLQIEVPPERVASEMEEVVTEFRNRMSVPGFRKGKAPLELIEARLGSGLDVEFLQRVIPRVYEEALDQVKLLPISEPNFEDIRFKRGDPLSFKATFEVRPQISVSGYKGLELEKAEFDITEEDVDHALEELRRTHPEYLSVEREARDGDLLIIDYEKLGDSGESEKTSKVQGYPLVLGSHVVLDEIEEALAGTKKGEQIKVKVTFSDEHRDDKLAGKRATFRVDVKEVKEQKEAVLDDEFAKRLGAKGGLEEMRSRVRLELDGKSRMRAQEAFEEALFDRLFALNSFELPQTMVDRMLQSIVTKEKREGTPEEEAKFREGITPSVVRFIKRHLVIQQVASQENLNVTDEDVEKELDRIAQFQTTTVDEVKDRLKDEGEMERLRDNLLERKVTEYLVSQARVKTVRRPLGKLEVQ